MAYTQRDSTFSVSFELKGFDLEALVEVRKRLVDRTTEAILAQIDERIAAGFDIGGIIMAEERVAALPDLRARLAERDILLYAMPYTEEQGSYYAVHREVLAKCHNAQSCNE